jgi:hypothetical protein
MLLFFALPYDAASQYARDRGAALTGPERLERLEHELLAYPGYAANASYSFALMFVFQLQAYCRPCERLRRTAPDESIPYFARGSPQRRAKRPTILRACPASIQRGASEYISTLPGLRSSSLRFLAVRADVARRRLRRLRSGARIAQWADSGHGESTADGGGRKHPPSSHTCRQRSRNRKPGRARQAASGANSCSPGTISSTSDGFAKVSGARDASNPRSSRSSGAQVVPACG